MTNLEDDDFADFIGEDTKKGGGLSEKDDLLALDELLSPSKKKAPAKAPAPRKTTDLFDELDLLDVSPSKKVSGVVAAPKPPPAPQNNDDLLFSADTTVGGGGPSTKDAASYVTSAQPSKTKAMSDDSYEILSGVSSKQVISLNTSPGGSDRGSIDVTPSQTVTIQQATPPVVLNQPPPPVKSQPPAPPAPPSSSFPASSSSSSAAPKAPQVLLSPLPQRDNVMLDSISLENASPGGLPPKKPSENFDIGSPGQSPSKEENFLPTISNKRDDNLTDWYDDKVATPQVQEDEAYDAQDRREEMPRDPLADAIPVDKIMAGAEAAKNLWSWAYATGKNIMIRVCNEEKFEKF